MDKWEVCALWGANISLLSPQMGSTNELKAEFIKKNIDPQFEAAVNDNHIQFVIIKWLLDNGWEPLSETFFRRKIQ